MQLDNTDRQVIDELCTRYHSLVSTVEEAKEDIQKQIVENEKLLQEAKLLLS